MGSRTELYVVVNGIECPVDPSDRSGLTFEEAAKVERLSEGVAFFSVRTGDPMPFPLWAAVIAVQVQRTVPDANPAELRKTLKIGDLQARVVDDGQPTADDGTAPDPTDGEGTSDEPSPGSEPSTSDTSPTS